MYIRPEQFEDEYRRICRSSMAHTTCKLVIFVSCLNVDALCGARILSDLLRAQLIPHKTVPVAGYEEMTRKYWGLDDDIVNVFLVGFGSTQDVGLLLRGEQEEEEEPKELKRIYIIDSNRPWHLDNILDPSIVCFDDGSIAGQDELLQAYQWLNDMSAEDLDALSDVEDEGDANSEADDNADTDADTDEDEDALVDRLVDSGTKRQQSLDPESRESKRSYAKQLLLAKRQKEDYENLVRAYYHQGNSQSMPAACMLYTLLSLVGETSVTRLWFAVVGASSFDSQYPQVYQDTFPMLRDEVNRMCGGPNEKQSGEATTLRLETDYSLFVLRHWSLYDSMFHTDYLWAKLRLWTERGRQNFHKMLALMGVSLTESREVWVHLNVSVKKNLHERIEKAIKVADLEDLIRPGVVRRFGYKGSLTAGDCVDATEALLQSGVDTSLASRELLNEGVLVNPSHEYTTPAERDKFWVANFWNAWDALEDVDTLLLGVDKTKLLQQAVARTATAMIEKSQVRPVSDYLVAVVKEGPDLAVFRNPLALCRLGIWIAQTKAESNKKKYSPPLVVASLDTNTGNFLVLGMNPRQARDYQYVRKEDDDEDRFVFNRFTRRFAKAAEEVQTRYKMDMFEMAVIEVDKHDLTKFLEKMTTISD